MGFAFDTPTDPYKVAMDQTDIDTWWGDGSKAKITHWHDDAHGYIMRDISSRIPAGHNIKHGVDKNSGNYYLTISGPNINKSWT